MTALTSADLDAIAQVVRDARQRSTDPADWRIVDMDKLLTQLDALLDAARDGILWREQRAVIHEDQERSKDAAQSNSTAVFFHNPITPEMKAAIKKLLADDATGADPAADGVRDE